MDDTERNARQDATELAHGIVLREIVSRLFADPVERSARRDLLCEAMEKLYTEQGLKPHAHLALQKALAEIEAIFAPAQSDQKPLPRPE